jgi:hypothetical protein
MRLCLKAGPFGFPSIAAHAHCDQLSVLLRAGGADLLTDGGTYAYHGDEQWRRHFKGTAAHNTVRVDGRDQAEYGGPFLWTTHADGGLVLEQESARGYRVRGHHDGYRRLADPVTHERIVEWRDGCGWRVTDSLAGSHAHRFELFWNLGAGCEAVPAPAEGWAGAWTVTAPGGNGRVLVAVRCSAAADARTTHGGGTGGAFVSRKLGEKTPATRIEVAVTAPAVRFETMIVDADHEGARVAQAAARWAAGEPGEAR